MPRIKFIFWERRGRLAAEARPQLDSAMIVEVRDEREFLTALQQSTIPIVILERLAVGDSVADTIAAAASKDAWIIVVGAGSADERRRDLDLGVRFILTENSSRRAWSMLVRRLLQSLQDRLPRHTSPTT
jgi:DNA-binding NarL/FixJ family response regulator